MQWCIVHTWVDHLNVDCWHWITCTNSRQALQAYNPLGTNLADSAPSSQKIHMRGRACNRFDSVGLCWLAFLYVWSKPVWWAWQRHHMQRSSSAFLVQLEPAVWPQATTVSPIATMAFDYFLKQTAVAGVTAKRYCSPFCHTQRQNPEWIRWCQPVCCQRQQMQFSSFLIQQANCYCKQRFLKDHYDK